jgi:hypothetical protein
MMASMSLGAVKETRNKKTDLVGRFLQLHILGLMTRFTDVINDSISIHPQVTEQRRCIRALEEIIRICQSYARIARPQVRQRKNAPAQAWLTVHIDLGLSSVCCFARISARTSHFLLGSDAQVL